MTGPELCLSLGTGVVGAQDPGAQDPVAAPDPPAPAGALGFGVPVVEAEGRLGLRFGSKRHGVLAAVVRLGWNLGTRERASMPQFGVTLGFAFL